MKKSEKTRQRLYNVGFIGIENEGPLRTRSCENYVTIEVTRVDVVLFISSLDHRHGRILSRRRGERPGDHAQESLLLRHKFGC
jgi:hypothetical protein